MEIVLPELFEEKLRTNRELRSAVDGTIADFNPWLKDSKLPFFVDYTDHGIDHLSQVLETASRLIPQEAIPLVSAGDVAVLTIAILLHDSAMHLSEAGFETLIRSELTDHSSTISTKTHGVNFGTRSSLPQSDGMSES